MRHGRRITAVDALWAWVEPFFSLVLCFHAFIADPQARILCRSVRVVLRAVLAMERAETRLEVGKMDRSGDLNGARRVACPNLADRMELAVMSHFIFENAKPRSLGFDFSVRGLELPLHAGLWINVRQETVTIAVEPVRDGLFLVTWTESDKTTVIPISRTTGSNESSQTLQIPRRVFEIRRRHGPHHVTAARGRLPALPDWPC
jgi:hypothetical protein